MATAAILPNAQNIVAIVMLLLIAILFLIIIVTPSASGFRDLYKRMQNYEREGLGKPKKMNRLKMFAWIGFLLSVILAIVFAFENVQFSATVAGQNAAMMASIVIAVVLIAISIPGIAGYVGATNRALSGIILGLSAAWIIVSAVVYSYQANPVQ